MLPATRRLPKNEIPQVMRYGQRLDSEQLLVRYKKTNAAPRFAFVVSTRVDRRATRRNKIKRMLRDVAQTIHAPIDAVVIVRKSIADASGLARLISTLQ